MDYLLVLYPYWLLTCHTPETTLNTSINQKTKHLAIHAATLKTLDTFLSVINFDEPLRTTSLLARGQRYVLMYICRYSIFQEAV